MKTSQSKFRIGIVNLNYECAATLGQCFEPWAAVKQGALSNLVESVSISSAHVLFPENAEQGFPVISEDHTVGILKDLERDHIIDTLFIGDQPMEETPAWNLCLAGLPDDINLLCLLGSDEVYTVEEIKKTLEYIAADPLVDYYKVNFKNFMGPKTWNDGFTAPRWWNVNKNGGFDSFYKDDLCLWKNGKRDFETAFSTIPNVHPAHFSWAHPRVEGEGWEDYFQRNKKFQLRKVAFSTRRYEMCSYVFDTFKQELVFNKEYYLRTGKPIPETFYE